MNPVKKLTNSDLGLLILRFGTGGLMMFHGIYKMIHGHDFIRTVLQNKGLPEFLWIGVPTAEVLAPLLLILGIITRISSILITFVMLLSIYLAFGLEAFELNKFGGMNAEYNIFFIFASLALSLTGPGKYSLNKTSNALFQ